MKMKLNDQQLRQIRDRVFGTELREGAPARDRPRGMTTVREQVAPGRAFREAAVSGNVIQGVAVLTPRSVNGGPKGRRYLMEALRDGARIINEDTVQMFLDHAQGKGDRSVRDLAGTYRRGRLDGRGVLRADVKLLDTPFRATLLSAAEEQPEALALSIDARGSARMEDGVEVVESLSALKSVDVVAKPASTSGLFESLQESARGQRGFRPVTGEVILEASRSLF